MYERAGWPSRVTSERAVCVFQLSSGELVESDERVEKVDVLVEGADSAPPSPSPPPPQQQLSAELLSSDDAMKGAESDGEEKKDEEKPFVTPPPPQQPSMHVDFEEGSGAEGSDSEAGEQAQEERPHDESSRPVSEQAAASEAGSEPAINPVLAQLLHDDKERFELGVEEVITSCLAWQQLMVLPLFACTMYIPSILIG